MGCDDVSGPLVLVSADCHAGPEFDALGVYVDPA